MEVTWKQWQISVSRTLPHADQVRAQYDVAAARWQGWQTRLGFQQAYDALFGRLQAEGVLATVPDGGHVLDAGIGSGAFSLSLLRTLRQPLHLTGVDLSERMVEEAARTLSDVAGARLQQGDLTHLDFPDASFDLVLSAHALEHLPDPRVGLAELARVARPDALIIVALTCPGMWDSWQALRWQHRAISADQLLGWAEELGLGAPRLYACSTAAPLLSRWRSLAYVIPKQARHR